ncbi:MAG TPA: peptidyl-prolyl cis-trans isomerase [Solirubrobacterales bacterium]|nr:peptidyl-prolyl cis-trans isomerase [Solirubrobacterales bacterium]
MATRRKSPRQRPAAGRGARARGALSGPRLPLVVFGALFVLLFAGFAIAQGIGRPDATGDTVAVVEEAPGDGVDTITQEEFDRALEQAAARAGVGEVPKEGTGRYRDIAQAALNDLLDTVWIQGEAEEQGVEASERKVDQQLEQIKSDNFQTEKQFQAFLKQSKFTTEDVDLRVRLQILSQELQQAVNEDPPAVSSEDVADYYEGTKAQYELPETRDVRLILNRDKARVERARAELEKDSSPAAWSRVAKEFSTDPASQANGGQRPGLTEGLVEEPLNREIFAAEQGELSEPVKTPLGWYVFEVDKVTPAKTQDLDEVRDQIRTQLEQQAQQEAFSSFIDDYGSKWQSRTVCNEDLFDLAGGPSGPGALERCSNFTGSGRPEGAPPGCYAEDPKGGRPAACPAPVVQLAPALPGTISVLAPQGQRLPQRPRPLGLPEPTPQPGGLPGAVPGLPPGASP